MKRIPEKNPEPGFGGDSPEFRDRGKGGDKPDFADLITGKAKGRTNRDQITFYRNVGNQGLQFSSVGGWVYEKCKRAEARPRDPDRVVAAGHQGLAPGIGRASARCVDACARATKQ